MSWPETTGASSRPRWATEQRPGVVRSSCGPANGRATLERPGGRTRAVLLQQTSRRRLLHVSDVQAEEPFDHVRVVDGRDRSREAGRAHRVHVCERGFSQPKSIRRLVETRIDLERLLSDPSTERLDLACAGARISERAREVDAEAVLVLRGSEPRFLFPGRPGGFVFCVVRSRHCSSLDPA